jgi:branched-chain amino acid transport system substrate-binding protein
MRQNLRSTAAAAILAYGLGACAAAFAGSTMRIAYVDPLSGAFAEVGQSALKHFQAMASEINAKGGMNGKRVEVVPFDSGSSEQGSLVQLNRALGEGIRVIAQGSSASGALIEALDRYNARHRGQEALYLNYAAADPALANDRCSFWRFRFDASSRMKMDMLTTWIAKDRSIRNLYLIDADDDTGRLASKEARSFLALKRPDARIVGDELHPPGQLKDFAPYVARIKASDADAVVTADRGRDMALLTKAAGEARLAARFYTFYAGGPGALRGVGDFAVGRLKQVSEWHENVLPSGIEGLSQEFRKKTGVEFHYLRIRTLMLMLAEAAKKARSNEPKALARALEGMRYDTATGEVQMRSTDHQLLQPLYLSTLYRQASRGGPKQVKYDIDGTGLGFKTDAKIAAEASAQVTSCVMARP